MSGDGSTPRCTDAVTFALRGYSANLTRVLPVLLFSRDWDSLVRWSKVRSWVDNAMGGDVPTDLLALDLAVAYLLERGADGPGSER